MAIPPKKPGQKTAPTAAAIIPALVAVFLGSGVAIYQSTKDDAEKARPRPEVPQPESGPPTAAEPKRESHAAARRADFDFYLLAMTLHPSFCADRERKKECRVPQAKALVIHGLWPEKRASGQYPRDCPAPRLSLEPALANELRPLMPGMEDGLHEHEWREHGGCSGLDDDAYFQATLDRARVLDEALGAKLTTLAGRETDARELRAVADGFRQGLGATLTFHCRTPRGAQSGSRPWLNEVRQCLDDDGPGGGPSTPLDCATVDRRDQGCGGRFHIAGR